MTLLGITPSKALGQNFLHDRTVVRKIVDGAGVVAADTVLEIGPGLGILTEELASRVKRVVAVELDSRLAAHLSERMPENVSVVHADGTTIDPAALAGTDYRVVANLPYAVGNAIVRRLQEADPPPKTITVMLQREVAERMAAVPPAMSILAVATQFYGNPRILFRVGGGAFIPPPNVESAVIRIDTHQTPLPRDVHETFFRVVHAGFSQRRKQLANTLSSGLDVDRQRIISAMMAAGIAPTERAERLRVEDWVRLYDALHAEHIV